MVRSDLCGLEGLFTAFGIPGRSRDVLGLGPGWPREWTATLRTNGGEVACAVRDLPSVPLAGCEPVRPKAFRSQACTSVGRGIDGGIIAPRDGTAADRNLSVLSPQPHPPVIRWDRSVPRHSPVAARGKSARSCLGSRRNRLAGGVDLGQRLLIGVEVQGALAQLDHQVAGGLRGRAAVLGGERLADELVLRP